MNEYIALAVDELYRLGLREIVLSPGSRSTPLSMLFCEYKKFKVYLDIDERSAAFFALGISKEFSRPVILVCTSGSAAGHYLPAVMEAKYSRIPLIILTADRPPELQNVGAPQTINQNNIFGGFVNYNEELSVPDEKNYYTYPRIVMRKAFLKCQGVVKGPVQINIPLCEPLVPELNEVYFNSGRSPISFQYLSGIEKARIDIEFLKGKKGIIVCGPDAFCDCQKEVIALGERLKAPILADPLSNMRSHKSEVIIDSYDAFLKDNIAKSELKPEYIFLFGQAPVSKRLQQFISLHNDIFCLQVDTSGDYRNPSLTTTHYVQASINEFIDQIHYINTDDTYLKRWRDWQERMRRKMDLAAQEPAMFEGKIVQILQSMMPENGRLVVANSMSIRDIDYFWKSKDQKVKILCNRGTNGIDGTISTALGVSTCGNPTVLLTGDLAFYHDMNGLLVGKTHGLNLVIILINNDGGGIFQYLPPKGKKYFDYLFSTPHGVDFKGVQTLYGVNYHKVSDYTDFQESFLNVIKDQGIHVLEVATDKERSWELHEKYTTL